MIAAPRLVGGCAAMGIRVCRVERDWRTILARKFLGTARFVSMAERSKFVGGRRKFLRTGIIGAVAAAIAPKLSGSGRPHIEVTSLDKKANLDAARANAIGGATIPVASFEFDEITIGELQHGMMSGKYTARSVTEKYLARIEEIDKHGPGINSVIEVNPDALAIANAIDKGNKTPRVVAGAAMMQPLLGIPILIKDNIDTA